MPVPTATQTPDPAPPQIADPGQAAERLPGAADLPGLLQFHIDLERERDPLFGIGVPFRYTVLCDGRAEWSGTIGALHARDAADGVYDCIAETLRYDPAVVIEIRGGDGGGALLAKRTSTQPRGARLPGAAFNVCKSYQAMSEESRDCATAREIRARSARLLAPRARRG